jgi:hypothetical protein
MSELNPSPNFQVGDRVRVKHGVVEVDNPDIPLGGWAGTIMAIEGMCLVAWSEETLANIPAVYRKRCLRDDVDVEEYWLGADDLEPDPGGPLCMEQPTNIIPRPLSADDWEDRIRMVFGLTSDDALPEDGESAELTYFNHLKASLAFPFAAWFADRARQSARQVTVTGMCDEFPIDEGFGVVCEVVDRGENVQVPLSKLEVEPGAPNHQAVDDYLTWFANAPEADVDDDPEGDWDDEDDEDWDDEEDLDSEDEDLEDAEDDFDDEPEEDYEDRPPPARQKVGRNDPCPCGSGKKFKKCCLGKQPPQQEPETGSKFPVGTIALYGPDDKRTTKIAAAVIKWEGANPILKRWVGSNVKDNAKVRGEIQEFFKKYGVHSVVASDGNMGCPHEEGKDFPTGGDCPLCPFWKGKQGSGAKG